MYKIEFANEWEEDTHEAVCLGNEYQLPSRIDGWVVVDLGFHIGSFADICLRRGASRVVGLESDPRNFQKGSHFFRDEERVEVWNQAIWDQSGVKLSILQDPRLENSGGKQVFDPDVDHRRANLVQDSDDRLQTGVVESVTLRDFLDLANVSQVDFVKFDIEGAEVQVLRNLVKDPETFARIPRLTVEWHGKERQQFARQILEKEGFTVEDDHPFEDPAFGHVGYLYAVRE